MSGRRALRVEVVHGSAHASPFPVWVTQIAGDPPSSAVEAMDVALGGRVRALLSLGALSEDPAGVIEVRNPGDASAPTLYVSAAAQHPTEVRGALRDSVTRVVSRLLVEAMLSCDRAKVLGLSCVLPDVTRWARSLDVTDLVFAVIDGIRGAHRHVARYAAENALEARLLGTLSFYEVRRDLATRIAHAVREAKRLLDDDPDIEIEAAAWLKTREGYLEPRAALARQLINVVDVSVSEVNGEVGFEVVGEGEGAASVIERIPSMDLKIASSADGQDVPQVPRAQVDLLPPGFRGLLDDGAIVRLRSDAGMADRPWEILLLARDSDVGVSMPVIVRVLDPTSAVRRPLAGGRRALVIGDPAGSDGPVLPAARLEAEAIERLLAGLGFEVDRLVGDERTDVDTLRAQLVTGEYRIVHIAAHGRQRGDDTWVSLGGERLDAGFWRRVERVPEVVFLNACLAGQVSARYITQLPTLADAVISSGVRVFAGSAWQVQDDAARAFSERFYGALARELPLADALRAARRAALNAAPTRTTWAAFQVYGDPRHVLGRGSPRGGEEESIEVAVSDEEIVAVLRSFIGRCRTHPRARLAELRAELARIDLAVKERYQPRSDGAPMRRRGVGVDEYLANAWLDLGEVARAFEYQQRALAHRDCRAATVMWWIESASRLGFHDPGRGLHGPALDEEADRLARQIQVFGNMRFHTRIRRAAALVRSRGAPPEIEALVRRALEIAGELFPDRLVSLEGSTDRRMLWCEWIALSAVWRGPVDPRVAEPLLKHLDALARLSDGGWGWDREYDRTLRGHAARARALLAGDAGALGDAARVYAEDVGRRALRRWRDYVVDDTDVLAVLAGYRGSALAAPLDSLAREVERRTT